MSTFYVEGTLYFAVNFQYHHTFNPMLKILIADDYEIVRRGLKQILLDEFPLATIDEAVDTTDLVQKARSYHWDIIISDLVMPGGGGLFAMKEIRKEKPGMPVLFLSINSEDHYALQVLKAGAHGYLNKDIVPAELGKAVRQILTGKKYITEWTAEKIGHKLNGSGVHMHEFLSEREMEVFRLLAAGKTITEIGEILAMESSIATTYRSRVLKKLNLGSNADVTRYSIEYKLVDTQ